MVYGRHCAPGRADALPFRYTRRKVHEMKRVLIFAYGLIAYVLFLVTFLYSIGFVDEWVVPKAINSGVEGPIARAVVINILLLGLFAVQHSVMARPGFKAWWTKFVPEPIERSTYVLATCIAFVLLFWQWQPITATVWSVEQVWARTLLFGVSLGGWALVLYSTFVIDHFDLFGLRQVVLQLRGREYTQPPFMVRSVYKFVRHPLMGGFVIAFWATPDMTGGHLLFSAVTTAYIFVGIALEERDHLQSLGEDYRLYRARTPMIVPFFRRAPARCAVSVPSQEKSSK